MTTSDQIGQTSIENPTNQPQRPALARRRGANHPRDYAKANIRTFRGALRPLPKTDVEALELLGTEPGNAAALITVYENHRAEFKKAAARWFGNNQELRNRAVNEILVAVARRANTYDPESVDPTEWIRKCADSEAQRLHKIWTTVNVRRPTKGNSNADC